MQNTRSVRAASFHATSQLLSQLMSTINGDAELSRIIGVGSQDLGALDPDARRRFMGVSTQLFSYYQDVFHQHREGLLDAELWASRRKNIAAYLRSPGVQEFWSQHGELFTESFRAKVDSELAPRSR